MSDEDDGFLKAMLHFVQLMVFAIALMLFAFAYVSQPRLPLYEPPETPTQ